jgi:hypothetical protein
MSRRGGGFLDAAYEIFKEAGQPMHAREIVRIGLERGLFTTRAQNPAGTLANTLDSEVTRNANPRGFTRLGNGHFGLAEWGNMQSIPVRHRGTPRVHPSQKPGPVLLMIL